MVITIWLKEWKPGLNWESSGSQHTHCEIHIFQFLSLLKKDNLGCNWRKLKNKCGCTELRQTHHIVGPSWLPPLTVLHILQFYSSLSLLVLAADGRGSSWLSDGLRVLEPLLERLLPPPRGGSPCSQPCHGYLLLIPPLGTQPFEITSLKMSQGMSWPNWIRGKVRCFFSSPWESPFLKATKQEVDNI